MRRKRWRRVGGVVLALLGLLVADWALYPVLAPIGGQSHDRGRNGLWLRYTWYFGERPPSEVPEMAKRLRDHGIRYAFFHVRFILRDGTLRYRYPDRARTLNTAVKREAPETRRIAWVYAGNDRAEGNVVLSDPKIRAKMVREAAWLVQDCGFDGIQWDYEICPDRDPNFLSLLDETRAALPKEAFLGVCSPVSYPWPLHRFGWSEGYFGEVARRCDQIAVMTYDTGFFTPHAYVGLVAASTERVTKAVADANPRCGVLIGLPTYGPGFISHQPYAENLRMGLKGVRESSPDPRTFEGVAPFADYTTDDEEWNQLKKWWR